MEDNIEEQLLNNRSTIIKQQKIVINPQYSTTQVDTYLKGMIEKIHKKQVDEAMSKDSLFRQKQLKDLRKKLIQYSHKQNTSNILNLDHISKKSRIRIPVNEKSGYIGKYNIKVAMKVHTFAELQQLERLKTTKQNWNKSCQTIFKSPNFQKMNHILKQTQDSRPQSAFCDKLEYRCTPVISKPMSVYRPRSRNQRGTSVKIIPKYGFRFKLPM